MPKLFGQRSPKSSSTAKKSKGGEPRQQQAATSFPELVVESTGARSSVAQAAASRPTSVSRLRLGAELGEAPTIGVWHLLKDSTPATPGCHTIS
jgi:hypothetical protein